MLITILLFIAAILGIIIFVERCEYNRRKKAVENLELEWASRREGTLYKLKALDDIARIKKGNERN